VTFKQFRIGVLLLVLVLVALSSWITRARSVSWQSPLWVAIYAIRADDSPVTNDYVSMLNDATFEPIQTFMASEAADYGVSLAQPTRVRLYGVLDEKPPQLARDAGVLQRIVWSLRFRWWAWGAGDVEGLLPPDVRIFVLYHDPALSPRVPHSLGMQKGLLGMVHAFADPGMTGDNNIVIAHEFLHTLGATDKYDPQTNQPLYPQGYADPDQEPLHPQEYAEIMAGRRPVTASEWEMPSSLRREVIGAYTAAEINWTQ